jgi:signal transduction histidine kinase
MVFLTVMAACALAYFTEQGIITGSDRVIHTYQARSRLSDLQVEVMRARDSEVNSLLSRDTGEIFASREQAQLATHLVDELRGLTKDNPAQQKLLQQIGPLLKQESLLLEHPPTPMGARVLLSPDGRAEKQKITKQEAKVGAMVDTMQRQEDSLLEQRLRAWNYLFRRNVLILSLALVIVAIMLYHRFRMLVTDVARTKDRERQVRDNAESYRMMSARILELQDSERRRIARELHDSVGQFLAGLKINLNQLEAGPRVDRRRLIRETIELTDCALQEVRTLSHLLHPPLLEELGFISAARWYLDEYGKRSQVRVSLEVTEPIERLPREIEIALFRVLQEALTNVHRHAAAESVTVRIFCRDGRVSLTVADDGKGIPQDVLAKFRRGAAPGIGLAGMRERLAEFGGDIRVESSAYGSILQAVIPTDDCSSQRRRAA